MWPDQGLAALFAGVAATVVFFVMLFFLSCGRAGAHGPGARSGIGLEDRPNTLALTLALGRMRVLDSGLRLAELLWLNLPPERVGPGT